MVSIIIVGYNSEKYLKECLESVFASSYNKFEVIFVDNNSQDNSKEYIEKNFPRVNLINSKDNLGFAGGNNIGIKKAISDKSDYIFLLNPDTIIDQNCLGKLVEKADGETILQPLILLHDGKQKTDLINSAGNILNFLGFSYCGSYKKKRSEIISDKDIPVASGAAMFIPVKIIKKIGAFDESFFMYHEDVDLSWRAMIAGHNIRLTRDSLIWHKYSFSRNKNKMFYTERNRILFIIKNFSLRHLLLTAPMQLIITLALLLYFASDGIILSWFRIQFAVIKSLPALLQEKRKIIKTIPPQDLRRFLSGSLNFSELNSRPFRVLDKASTIYWKLIISLL